MWISFFYLLYHECLCIYNETDIFVLKYHHFNFFPSTVLAHLSESKLPKDEALRLLRVEMQRCLGSLKGKRQKISQLQEELQRCQGRVNELQVELDEASLSASVRAFPDKNKKKGERM